jgi:hypothetical protein
MELLFKFIRNLGILIIGVILVLIIMVPLVWLIQKPWNYLSSGIILIILVAFIVSLIQYLNEKDK